ncbi:MAG: hypothetical protein PHG29_14535 [Prolixibacteraceae bacterium]|nr:hypothetical protein [Prolixibacteraceae bacterium]
MNIYNLLDALLKNDSLAIVGEIKKSLQSKSIQEIKQQISEAQFELENLQENNLKILETLATSNASSLHKTLQFKNGDDIDVDKQTAKGLFTLYSGLNDRQKVKFEDSLQNSIVSYMQLIKFAKDKNIL